MLMHLQVLSSNRVRAQGHQSTAAGACPRLRIGLDFACLCPGGALAADGFDYLEASVVQVLASRFPAHPQVVTQLG